MCNTSEKTLYYEILLQRIHTNYKRMRFMVRIVSYYVYYM